MFLLIRTPIPRKTSIEPDTVPFINKKVAPTVDIARIYGANDLFDTYVAVSTLPKAIVPDIPLSPPPGPVLPTRPEIPDWPIGPCGPVPDKPEIPDIPLIPNCNIKSSPGRPGPKVILPVKLPESPVIGWPVIEIPITLNMMSDI